MRKRRFSRINEILEMPVEISTEQPKITILGFNKMMVENHRGILEYQDIFIRIKTTIGMLNVSGIDLTLNEMRNNELIINGKIDEIEFETITD